MHHSAHHNTDHGSHHDHSHHGIADACSHALDHMHHAFDQLGTHLGHAVDTVMGYHTYQDFSPGGGVHDVINVAGAGAEATAACNPFHQSFSSPDPAPSPEPVTPFE